MTIVRLAAISFLLLFLTGCETALKKISADHSQQLRGQGLEIVVLPAATLASNLSGASFFGAIGQSIKGGNLQSSLQLQDPARTIEPRLRDFLSSQYGTTTASNQYRLEIKTSYWWIGVPAGAETDDIVTGTIIEMKLIDPSGSVIAGATFNGGGDPSLFPINKQNLSNSPHIQGAFDNAAGKASEYFIQVLKAE